MLEFIKYSKISKLFSDGGGDNVFDGFTYDTGQGDGTVICSVGFIAFFVCRATLAVFHIEGNSPALTDSWKIFCRTGEISLARFF